MKRLLVLAAGLLLLAPGLRAQVTADLKVGYIDSQAILEQSPAAQAAAQQFDQEVADLRAEVDSMGQELEQMIQSYEAQQGTMSPENRAQREQAILEKRGEYQQRVQELQQQASQRQAELVQPVMDEISEVIEEIRAEGSYHLIFDVAAGSIISADPSLDITDEVLRRLRARSDTGDQPSGG
jgi:outer membrane protein